uniref:Uncharacterized protein n=1 Tax=Triticum urartu TaxID=4572 RepID=A0A8R7TFF9_TRIUA
MTWTEPHHAGSVQAYTDTDPASRSTSNGAPWLELCDDQSRSMPASQTPRRFTSHQSPRVIMLVLRRGRRSSSGYPALPCQQQQNIESEYLPSSKIPTHKERERGRGKSRRSPHCIASRSGSGPGTLAPSPR